jgi:hypothetical protein
LDSTYMSRNLAGSRQCKTSLEGDGAASDWETIALGNEADYSTGPTRSVVKQRSSDFEFVLHAQDILPRSRSNGTLNLRRYTVSGLPDHPAQRVLFGERQQDLPTFQSFYSSSSLYSDNDVYDGSPGRDLLERNDPITTRNSSGRRPATLSVNHDLSSELATWRRFSKASSSTGEDPFKYDAVTYSAFLQPVAEREVSSALRRLGVSQDSFQAAGPSQSDYASSLKQTRIANSSFYNTEAIRSA